MLTMREIKQIRAAIEGMHVTTYNDHTGSPQAYIPKRAVQLLLEEYYGETMPEPIPQFVRDLRDLSSEAEELRKGER